MSRDQSPPGPVRGSGILLHLTSLPGRYGIGQLGREAQGFLEFLKKAGQCCWQFLPLGPTTPSFGNSPYMSPSAFAGNPLLISIDLLEKEGLLTHQDLEDLPELSEYFVEFEKVIPLQQRLLERAWSRAKGSAEVCSRLRHALAEPGWLRDFCLFMALKERFDQKAWHQWPRPIASRRPEALEQAAGELDGRMMFHAFCQDLFDRQWRRLKEQAGRLGIKLFGDLPIYVSPDSADVWANQEIFDLDPKSLRPRFIAGVPPDYFSKTGQRWGNPLYRWRIGGRPNEAVYRWWRARFRRLRQLVDVIRIDHFRAFESYWKIPAREKTAVRGRWVKGPGAAFFRRMGDAIEDLEIVAEDLGTITPQVQRLRKALGFPGMKVLQFAFDSDETNPYLPHNFEDPDFVVYTGTHDNATTVGWYLDPEVSEQAKARARRYANSDGSRIHWDFIRMAYSSVASLAVVPMQDVLGFGDDCRMNRPSSSKGNWVWRLAPRFITDQTAEALADEARFYNRRCR